MASTSEPDIVHLAPLEWTEGPPPSGYTPYELGDPADEDDYCLKITTDIRCPIVLEMRDGSTIVMGDCNRNGGCCGCCSHSAVLANVVRWAMLVFLRDVSATDGPTEL